MSPGLAARSAIVCAIVCSALSAHAQAPGARPAAPTALVEQRPAVRRFVAVIDLTGDERTSKIAEDLHNALLDHAALKPIGEAFDLKGSYLDEDSPILRQAEDHRDRALRELGNHQLTGALAAAQYGQDALRKVVPTQAVMAMYADLALVVGAARLGDKKPTEAQAAFALCDRLVPGRKLDDNTTTLDVIAAFDAARTAAAKAVKVPVMIKGSGRAWVDGKELGPTGVYDLTVGPHVVWLTGSERITAGQEVNIVAGQSNTVEIRDDQAPPRIKIRRARVAMRNAVDPAARAVAMKTLAQLVKVGDAVLLSVSKNDKIIVQTWRDQAPGFAALSEYKGEKAIELLEPLAPSPKVAKVEPPPWTPPPFETPWYRKRKVQVSALATAVVIVGIILATSIEGHVASDTDPQFKTPPLR
jgi:hypothetical protein